MTSHGCPPPYNRPVPVIAAVPLGCPYKDKGDLISVSLLHHCVFLQYIITTVSASQNNDSSTRWASWPESCPPAGFSFTEHGYTSLHSTGPLHYVTFMLLLLPLKTILSFICRLLAWRRTGHKVRLNGPIYICM